MRQNPVLSAFMTVVNLAVVLLAVYLAIDSLDQSRRQSAKTELSLNRLAESLDRFSERTANHGQSLAQLTSAVQAIEGKLGNLRLATAQSGDALAAAPAPDAAPGVGGTDANAASGTFANDGLRDPNAEFGGSIVSRAQVLPGNLNNLVNNEATVSLIWGYLLDGLAERNLDDLTTFEPVMATGWEVSDDGLEYTIHLRDTIMWQPYVDPVTKKEVPAKRLTSRDFLFFWNTIRNQDIPCEALRTYYENMDSLDVVDDFTFIVRWKFPYSMAETFTLGMQPLPEHYYRPDPAWDDKRFAEEFVSSPRNQWIVGTGPYKLVKWDKNAEVLLERDDNYFGPRPYIQTRHIRVIPDNSVAFLEFQRGDVDIYGLLPAQWEEETPEPDFRLVTPDIDNANADSLEWDRRKKTGDLPTDYRFEKFQYKSQSWSYIGYNLQRPLFKDREVRTALTLLVDRNRILDEVYLGLGSIISGPFIPQSPYYNQAIKPLPFDIAEASRLLRDNGWEDTDNDGILDKDYDGSGERKPFRFTFIIPSSSATSRKIAAIVEQDMLRAKIKIDIKPIEWSVYTQLLENREFDVCHLGWSGGVEGDPYQIWHSSGAAKKFSSNHVGYASAEADELIDAGRRTTDKEERYALYRRLHEVIARDQPYTFLIAPTATIAQGKDYRNAIVYKSGQMSSTLQWLPRAAQEITR